MSDRGTRGLPEGCAVGLRGACRGAGGLQAGDGLKSAGAFRITPGYSFLLPHKRARQLGACSPAAFAVFPPGHLVPRLPDPSRWVLVMAWPRVRARHCRISACKWGCFCGAASETTADGAPAASRVSGWLPELEP